MVLGSGSWVRVTLNACRDLCRVVVSHRFPFLYNHAVWGLRRHNLFSVVCVRRKSYTGPGPNTSSSIFDISQEFRKEPRMKRNMPKCIFQGRLNAFAQLPLCKTTIDLTPCGKDRGPGRKKRKCKCILRPGINEFSSFSVIDKKQY